MKACRDIKITIPSSVTYSSLSFLICPIINLRQRNSVASDKEHRPMNSDMTLYYGPLTHIQTPNPVTIGNTDSHATCYRPTPKSLAATRAFSVNSVKSAVMATDPVRPVYEMDKNVFDALAPSHIPRRIGRIAGMLG